jgi:hypothetical protein
MRVYSGAIKRRFRPLAHLPRATGNGRPVLGALGWDQVMNREEIIVRLRENEAALRMRGVAHAALTGRYDEAIYAS